MAWQPERDDLRARGRGRNRCLPGGAGVVPAHRPVARGNARRRLPRGEHPRRPGRAHRGGARGARRRDSPWSTPGTWTARATPAAACRRRGSFSLPTATGSPSSSPAPCRPASRCTSPPTTGWWTCRRSGAPTRTWCPTSGPGSRCSAASREPGTSTRSPARPRTCWPPGRARSATRAWTVSREQAVDEGWFGPVDCRVADRVGDVISAARRNWAVVATAEEPRESALIGMHGSLAGTDQRIPLLTYMAS